MPGFVCVCVCLSRPDGLHHSRSFAQFCLRPSQSICALQMTAFAARLALDCERVEAGRLDCLPCVKLSPQKFYSQSSEAAPQPDAADAPGTESMARQSNLAFAHMPAGQPPAACTEPQTPDLPEVPPPDGELSATNNGGVHHDLNQSQRGQSLTSRVKALGRSLKGAAGRGWSDGGRGVEEGGGHVNSRGVYGVTPALHWYMERVHAPLLAKPAVQLVTLALFVGLFVLSLAALPHVSR